MIDRQTQQELRNIYNPDDSDLRNLQLRMLEILKSVDEICIKHGIPYWLSSGTLLGAVRHGGFIPWDDDIDIELMRDDYVSLLKVLAKELPERYVLQTIESDSGYVYLYAKIRDSNSLVNENCVFNSRFKYKGAFIDIFPLERTNKALARIASVCYNRMCLGVVEKNGTKGFFRFNYFLLVNILFPFFRLLTLLCKKRRISHTYGVGFIDAERRENEIFPLCKISFEGYSFNAPLDYDAYLKRLYGSDYMQIPSQKSVHILDNRIKIW